MCDAVSTLRMQATITGPAMQEDHGRGALTVGLVEDVEFHGRMTVPGDDMRDRHVEQIPQILAVLGVSNGLENVIMYYVSARPSGSG